MNDALGLRAVATHKAMKALLDLLVEKGVLTRDEAFRVLESGADDAQENLDEIQNEANADA